jgi:ArsR family transcriptional regulator
MTHCCYLVEILDQLQPKIFRHLAFLRSAGIVAGRKEKKWMHYRIQTPLHIGSVQVFKQTPAWLAEEQAMQADRALVQGMMRA